MNETFCILKKYPFLFCNTYSTEWKGLLKLEDLNLFISITCEKYPSIENACVSLSDSDHLLWECVKEHVESSLLLESRSLLEFLDKFVLFMKPVVSHYFVIDNKFDLNKMKKFSKKCKEVLSEIELSIGEDKVTQLSGEFSNIILTCTDERENIHTLSLHIPENYPDSSPVIVNIDIPAICLSQITQEKSISSMYKKFCDAVYSLHNFWSVFSSLYFNCTVVDPEVAKKADTRCKIALGNGVLLTLAINPLDPFSCPELNLIGPEKIVSSLRNTVENNFKEINWDTQNELCLNLLSILGLDEFPRFNFTKHADFDNSSGDNGDNIGIGECSICFMLRTDDQEDDTFPTKLCPNPNCKTYFHSTCLAKWFLSIPMNEPTFDIICGPCPNCTKKISCPANS